MWLAQILPPLEPVGLYDQAVAVIYPIIVTIILGLILLWGLFIMPSWILRFVQRRSAIRESRRRGLAAKDALSEMGW